MVVVISVFLRFEKERFFTMIRSFNTHDRVIYNGNLYAVFIVSYSFDSRCCTLGLVGVNFISPLIWVCSDLVNKVSKKWKV